jgi:hypothetical protein
MGINKFDINDLGKNTFYANKKKLYLMKIVHCEDFFKAEFNFAFQ